MKKILIVVVALLAQTGCASNPPTTLKTYGVEKGDLWDLGAVVMTDYGFQIMQFDKEAGFIGAYRSFMGSPIEKMTLNVTCDPIEEHCRAVVLSMPAKMFTFNYNSDPKIVRKMLEILRKRQ